MKKKLVIASSVGRGEIKRQRCMCKTCNSTFLPFHNILPVTGNIYITKELRALGCFYIKDDSYRRSHDLLNLNIGDPDVISQREMENWAVEEGKRIRSSELCNAKNELEANNIDPEEISQMLDNKVTPVEVYGSANGAATPPLPETATDIPLEVAENSIKAGRTH